MTIQMEGVVRLGADEDTASDVAIDVISIKPKKNRKVVTSEATWGDATERDLAGARKPQVEVRFKNSRDADKFNTLVWAAADTDTAELYLAWAYDDAAIGAGNPLFYTTITVMSAEDGGQAGVENSQTQTYSCTSILSTSTDPQA